MGISIAEYLGQRCDINGHIKPIRDSGPQSCPFMCAPCSKVAQRNEPICSVRKGGTLWITCRHRLCSTKKNIPLHDYQKNILYQIAQILYGSEIKLDKILVKREMRIPNVANQALSADYIMCRLNSTNGPNKIILEMQGGGETSNTGVMTRHIREWVKSKTPKNKFLRVHLPSVNTIENNAWKRQSDQFLIKGNIAVQTGGRLVFCVGSLLFDYLWERIKGHSLQNLRDHNWTLALIGFKEDTSSSPTKGPVPLIIDKKKLLFTNYSSFVQILTNQGGPCPEMFQGKFESLAGDQIVLD